MYLIRFMGYVDISSLDYLKLNNSAEKFNCVILSGAVLDGLTETQESRIIRPILLQFRTLFRLFQTSLHYGLFFSLCMSISTGV